MPETFYFIYIDTLDKTGDKVKALSRANTYLEQYGKNGKHYGQVIEIASRLEMQADKEAKNLRIRVNFKANINAKMKEIEETAFSGSEINAASFKRNDRHKAKIINRRVGMNRFVSNFLIAMLLMIAANVACADDSGNAYGKSTADTPASGPGSFADMMDLYCMRFGNIEWEMVATNLEEMEATPYPVDSYFQTAACQPEGYGRNVKSPLLHVVADDTCKREEFLNIMWIYYNQKRHEPAKFAEAVNAKNTRGETLLDYLESQKQRDQYNEELQVSADKIIAIACSHGAVYSAFPNMKCP